MLRTWQLYPETVYWWGSQCSLKRFPPFSKCLLNSECVRIHLSPSLAGGVRLSGCLSSQLSPVWLVVSGFPGVYIHSSPFLSCVSQSSWWCPALWMFVFTSLLSCVPSLAGGVRLFGCLSSVVFLHLCPSLAGGVQLFGCLSPVGSLHLSPSLSGGVLLSGCLSSLVSLHMSSRLLSLHGPLHLFPNGRDVALHLSPFICLPACTCFPPFVYQSGWWCLALHVCHHLSFRMSFFTCLPAYVSQRVSGSPRISFFLSLFLSVCLSAAEMLHFPTNYLMIDGCDMMMEMLTMTIGRKSEVC